jgi:hypothetical protein
MLGFIYYLVIYLHHTLIVFFVCKSDFTGLLLLSPYLHFSEFCCSDCVLVVYEDGESGKDLQSNFCGEH